VNVLSEFTTLRTYARFLWEECRRETYQETVDRYLDWAFKNPLIPAKVKIKTREKMLAREVFGSMRALWTAGPAADLDSSVIYNCAFLCINDLSAFGEVLINLMCGCGVGYSVEREYISKLPVVNNQKNLPVYNVTVEDSRRGWKDAFDIGMSAWFKGRDCYFDFSKLRPMGAPLMTMGGRSSGPEVLRELLRFTRDTILGAQGRQLTSLECHDILCEIARVVIVGGTRRSALISLSDLTDIDLRVCKDFNRVNQIKDESERAREMVKLYRRFGANNSAVYYNKPDIFTFLDEWNALGRSGTGERGIANIGGARRHAPHRRKSKLIRGLNPCLRGDMRILTTNGYVRFDELEGQTVDFINANGVRSTGTVWYSGEKTIVRVRFRTDGVEDIYCTPDHRFMLLDGSECSASNLVGKRVKRFVNIKSEFDTRAFLAGFIQGDGCTSLLNSPIHRGMEVRFGAKDLDVASMFGQGEGSWYSREVYEVAEEFHLEGAHLPYRRLPERRYLSPDFLSGLYSANGCVIKGHRVAIKSTCYEMLTELKSVLKDWFDIDSYITTNKPTRIKFSNGEYLCRESYDLNISRYASIVKFAENISFAHSYKRQALKELLDQRSPVVGNVEIVGTDHVYDFSEPIINWGVVEGCVAHNCGEVALRDREYCNLSECVLRPGDDFETLRDKLTTAAWLSVIQSTHTNFPNLPDSWRENCEDERLCGVSITGQFDNLSLLTPEVLKLSKNHVVNTCRKASQILGINMPAATTSMKPSGCRTWESLTTTTEGVLTLEELFLDHPEGEEWAPFYRDVSVIQDGVCSRILKTYDNGISDIVKVNLSYGLSVKSTPNHQWFVKSKHLGCGNYEEVNDWIRADSLEPDHILDIRLGVYEKKSNSVFTKFNPLSIKMRMDCDEINQPSVMNKDIAWFLGYLWGDGAMSPSKYRVRFIDEHLFNLEKIQRILEDNFAISCVIRPASQGRNAFYIDVASKVFWHWLIRNDVWKYFAGSIDIIPKCVRQSSKDDILAFIAGLVDSDGWSNVYADGVGKASITTSSKLFAEHLQSVCWSVGVAAGCSFNSMGSNLQQRKEMYLLSFSSACLEDTMRIVINNSNKMTRTEDASNFSRWVWVEKKGIPHIIGKVKSVEFIDKEHTYDIEVEGSHWYFHGSIKSHNTLSVVADCSPGLHPRWDKYYLRSIQIATNDPLFEMMRDQGVPYFIPSGNGNSTAVLQFPVASPEGAVTKNDITALDQLDYYKRVSTNYTEHSASCTVYVAEHEWLSVANWVYDNWEIINGLTFFPKEDGANGYEWTPFKSLSEDEYDKLANAFPTIDFSRLPDYEKTDTTTGAKEVACAGGACEL